METHQFATKHPSNLTDSDVADIRQTLSGGRAGALRPWADHLLRSLTPDQAVEALRQIGHDLWPQLAAAIVLSGALEVQDEPPLEEYKHLFDEWEVDGEVFSKQQEYIDSHLSAPYVSSLGLLFDSLTEDERVRAINSCHPKLFGLMSHLMHFMVDFRPSLLPPLLPTIERKAGPNWGVVEALVKTHEPACHDSAYRITQKMKDRFSRFLAFQALHARAPERHYAETYSAALESMAGSDCRNNHHVAAEWLCRYAGEAGIAEVVRYLRTRDTMWLSSVAHFSIEVLGDRAQPIIEAAKEAGILEDDELT